MFENKVLLLRKEKYCYVEKDTGYKKQLYVVYSLNTKTNTIYARLITVDYFVPSCEMVCDLDFELWLKDFLKNEQLELYYSRNYFEEF